MRVLSRVFPLTLPYLGIDHTSGFWEYRLVGKVSIFDAHITFCLHSGAYSYHAAISVEIGTGKPFKLFGFLCQEPHTATRALRP